MAAEVDECAVIDHCAVRLARFKVPVRVAQIDAFPTTQSANATKIRNAGVGEQERETVLAHAGTPAQQQGVRQAVRRAHPRERTRDASRDRGRRRI